MAMSAAKGGGVHKQVLPSASRGLSNRPTILSIRPCRERHQTNPPVGGEGLTGLSNPESIVKGMVIDQSTIDGSG